ncbi:uncharacterized protein METZ01_LOCUS360643, partial [marine metagenome]
MHHNVKPGSVLVLTMVTMALLLSACGLQKTSTQPVVTSPDSTAGSLKEIIPTPVALISIPDNANSTEFTINPDLCRDDQGPDCTELRLGDDYFTTFVPEKGYLYSCNDKNPTAPGSREDKITWINFAENTWNLLQKLWLPETNSGFDPGSYREGLSDQTREITINNLPVDKKIGAWPMTDYPTLTEIDGNPGIPASQNSSFSYSANPQKNPTPTCVSLGAIGVTKNGVVIYNAAD